MLRVTGHTGVNTNFSENSKAAQATSLNQGVSSTSLKSVNNPGLLKVYFAGTESTPEPDKSQPGWRGRPSAELLDEILATRTMESEEISTNPKLYDLKGYDFSETDLRDINLPLEANLYRANLTEANLKEANLTYANLYRANLTEANLERANLYRANLTEANLKEADLYRANLTYANLTYANLKEANLYRANLERADLYRANLTEANLTYANLERADLYRANLERAKYNAKTQFTIGAEVITGEELHELGEDFVNKFFPGMVYVQD